MRFDFTDTDNPACLRVEDLQTAREWYGSCLSTLGWASVPEYWDSYGEFAGFEEEGARGISLFLRPIQLAEQAVKMTQDPQRVFIRADSPMSVDAFYSCAVYKRPSLWEPRHDPGEQAYSAAVLDYDGNVLIARYELKLLMDVEREKPRLDESTTTEPPNNQRQTLPKEPIYIPRRQASLEREPRPSFHERSSRRSPSHSEHRRRSSTQKPPASKPLGPFASGLVSLVSGIWVGYRVAREAWKELRQDERRRKRTTEDKKNIHEHSSSKPGKRSYDRRDSAPDGWNPKRREASPSRRPFVPESFAESGRRRASTFDRQGSEDRQYAPPSRRSSMPTQPTPHHTSYAQQYWNVPPPVPDAPPIFRRRSPSPTTQQQRRETISSYTPYSYPARSRNNPQSRRASESDRYARRPEHNRGSRETVRRPISEAEEAMWYSNTSARYSSRRA